MSDTLYIRDVKPDTKSQLEQNARKEGLSLSAYLRLKLDDLAKKTPMRELGSLEHLGPIGDPIDGWGPMEEDELALWEGGNTHYQSSD